MTNSQHTDDEHFLEARADSAEELVRSAREVLIRLTAHAPDVGVGEFLDAINDARLLIAKIDGAE